MSRVSDFFEEIDGMQAKIDKLEAAIRKHRDEKGDDRCWMDDEELYSVLPEGVPPSSDRRLHEPCTMIKHCADYIASRQPGGEAYVSVQREIESWKKTAENWQRAAYEIAYECGVTEQVPYSSDELKARAVQKVTRLKEKPLVYHAPNIQGYVYCGNCGRAIKALSDGVRDYYDCADCGIRVDEREK